MNIDDPRPLFQEDTAPLRRHSQALIAICNHLLRDLAANGCVLPVTLDLDGQMVKIENPKYGQNQITITVVK